MSSSCEHHLMGDALTDEVHALEAEVAALRRTVAALTDVLVRAGALTSDDRRLVERAGRIVQDDDDDDSAVDPHGAVVVSPYRGAAPIDGAGCAVCGKLLSPDDPELTLAKRGKVCTLCFTRG
jgi:hypothetical protein